MFDTTIARICPFCGRPNPVSFNKADYKKWKEGLLIQDAFPYLNADEREIIKTGICTPCWDKM